MARQGEAHVAPMVYGRRLGSARHDGTTDLGRWPSNVVLSHAYGCGAKRCAPTCPVAGLDAQSGRLRSGANPLHRRADIFRDCYGRFAGEPDCQPHRGADGGGASRFFPAFRWQAKAAPRERPRVEDVAHPTVKPLELMRWLVQLVTPPGGVILDPFLGSGTTAEAARSQGFCCLGIEREPDYIPLIRARLSRNAGDDVKHRSDPGAKHGTAGASPLDSDRGPPK
jgi:site-specific DNA-methyltransferase (adenine-specific)